jgi:DNA-binding response OmpR family regulator
MVIIDRNGSAVNHVEEFYRDGAVEVLDKASDPRIVNAAVNEVLRRKLMPQVDEPVSEPNTGNSEEATQENPVPGIGELEINMERVEVKYKGEVVKLTDKQRGILIKLEENKGRVVSEQAIVETVWNHAPDNHTILSMRVHLSKLRKKMPGLIETIRKHGYIIKSPTEDQS